MTYNFRKQLPVNVISNVGYFALNVVVGIWMVPYLIRHLAVEGYGFIPLAVSVTAYVGLISLALNGAVSRYLVISLHKNDNEGANRIFNTAFWSLALVSIILVPLSGIFSWLTPRIFNVPAYLTLEVQGLFFIVLLSFIVSVFSSVFSVSTFAHNRLDLRNLIDTGNILVRTGLIVLFFAFLPANLVSVGIAYLAGGLVSLLLGYFFFRKLTPVLKISRRYFDRSRLKELTSMGGWLVVGQTGTLLFLQIDLILCNILFSAHDTGIYAAIIQWNVLLRSMAGVVAVVLSPIVTISYALDQKERIVRMSKLAVRYMGLGIALPIGLLFGFADSILRVWLGPDFVQYASLLRLATFYLTINLAVLPLFGIGPAFNKVKWPGIVTLLTGMMNVLVAILLAKFLGWGLYGIAASGFIVLTVKNAIFAPLYFAHVLKISKTAFFKPLIAGCVATAVVSAASYLLSRFLVIENLYSIGLAGIGMAIVYLIFVWGCLFRTEDRRLFLDFIQG
jgi:membrane protein EpsK